MMAATPKRACKHMDGDIKCTKYAQWIAGNKGCYCHKHFRMMEQNNDQRGPQPNNNENHVDEWRPPMLNRN